MSFTSLDKDCIHQIYKWLSYVDIMSFRLVCVSHSIIKPPTFKDLFVSKLLEFKVLPSREKALDFCDNLYKTGAYVAGGFMLDCIYNTNHHSDIDIYDPSDPDAFGDRDTFTTKPRRNRPVNEHYMGFTRYLYKSGFMNLYIDDRTEPGPILRKFLHKSYPTIIDRREQFNQPCKDTIQIIPIGLELKGWGRYVVRIVVRGIFCLLSF